jgi:putative peptidoglycan lipid II flippase
MGTLNSLRSFFIPAIAPAMFNLSIISCALFLAPHFSVPILSIGLGVTVGGALQYGVQAAALIKHKFNVKPVFSFFYPGLKKIIFLVLPVVTATGITQINVLISNIFATYLSEGSVTYLYYGYRLVHFPIGIFVISMSIALLPSLSEHSAKKDMSALRDTFSFSLRLVFFTTIPAMAGLIALAGPIVNILFQRGEVGYDATRGTVYALIFYSSGLWAFAGWRIVRTVFYSLQDTKTPLKTAFLSVFINLFFCFTLTGPLRHGGLALALVLSTSVNFLILFLLLKRKLGRVDGRNIALSFMKTVIASLIMGATGWFIVRADLWQESGRILEKTGILTGVIALCFGMCVFLMHIMKSSELKYLYHMIIKKETAVK